ncbi:hypothetical protein NIES4073_06390 [Kalymmatonema gypsitolerans NIES-4073]|nr:hypothetical protein NIES4073_06390 [Scytonema sp. NIES-4073]
MSVWEDVTVVLVVLILKVPRSSFRGGKRKSRTHFSGSSGSGWYGGDAGGSDSGSSYDSGGGCDSGGFDGGGGGCDGGGGGD